MDELQNAVLEYVKNEYLDEDDVAVLAAQGTVAVLLPGAFYFLREHQTPPVEAFREWGVAMAVAIAIVPHISDFLAKKFETLGVYLNNIYTEILGPFTDCNSHLFLLFSYSFYLKN